MYQKSCKVEEFIDQHAQVRLVIVKPRKILYRTILISYILLL